MHYGAVSDLRCVSPDYPICSHVTVMIMKRTVSRLSAFSLPELLVVLVIIGILVLIALPNLMPLISRAKSTEAQQQLVFLHTLEKNNFYTYSKYSASSSSLWLRREVMPTTASRSSRLRSGDSGRRPRPWWISTAMASTTSGRSIRTRT